MAAARQAAIPLAKSLMKALDGAGTNEALAVQTIKKIKTLHTSGIGQVRCQTQKYEPGSIWQVIGSTGFQARI